MGGILSGSYPRNNTKIRTSSLFALDIRTWNKENLLAPGIQFTSTRLQNGNLAGEVTVQMWEEYFILKYIYNQTETITEVVQLTSTPCNFGGHRKWLRCPLCGSRVAVIYLLGKEFGCRKCHNLTYDCCNQSELDRVITKYNKAKAKIGGGPGIIAPIPERPLGMHRKTYEKILEEIYFYNYLLLTTVF